MTTTVRTAVPEDIHALMDLGLASCEENGLTDPDPKKLLAELWAGVKLDRGIIGAIGPVGGSLEAAILLRVDKLWYSSKDSLIERAVFVHPKYRMVKGGRGGKLVEFAKMAAQKLDLPLVIGILSSDRVEAKIRMYTRKLGEPSGAYWIWNGRTGHFQEAAE